MRGVDGENQFAHWVNWYVRSSVYTFPFAFIP
jgi:hypothetical protein